MFRLGFRRGFGAGIMTLVSFQAIVAEKGQEGVMGEKGEGEEEEGTRVD